MSVTASGQGLADILEAVQRLTSQEVLVGIPHGESRSDDDMTNAQIGYIQETGSPAMNLAARAFLAPGVEDCQELTGAQLCKAADEALKGNTQGVDRCLNRAGMIAQNSVKAKINNGDFEPLSQATLKARKAAGKTREKPLIDTGQLRNSITYVVKKVEK